MIYIVSNKRSGGYTPGKLETIREEFFLRNRDCIFKETVKDGKKITAGIDPEEINENDIIVAAGGDGTVNACLQYIHDNSFQNKIKLGVIPLGTGNNLIRSLNLKKNISEAVCIILEDNSNKVSYGLVNSESVFFNCSFGFTSFVLENRTTNSLIGYAYDGLSLIPGFKGSLIKLNNEEIKIFAGFFINTAFYMSKFRFLKKNNTGKKLKFFYLENKNFIRNAFASLSCLSGLYNWNEINEEFYKIEPFKNFYFEIDGDAYRHGSNENISIQNVSAVEVLSNRF